MPEGGKTRKFFVKIKKQNQSPMEVLLGVI